MTSLFFPDTDDIAIDICVEYLKFLDEESFNIVRLMDKRRCIQEALQSNYLWQERLHRYYIGHHPKELFIQFLNKGEYGYCTAIIHNGWKIEEQNLLRDALENEYWDIAELIMNTIKGYDYHTRCNIIRWEILSIAPTLGHLITEAAYKPELFDTIIQLLLNKEPSNMSQHLTFVKPQGLTRLLYITASRLPICYHILDDILKSHLPTSVCIDEMLKLIEKTKRWDLLKHIDCKLRRGSVIGLCCMYGVNDILYEFLSQWLPTHQKEVSEVITMLFHRMNNLDSMKILLEFETVVTYPSRYRALCTNKEEQRDLIYQMSDERLSEIIIQMTSMEIDETAQIDLVDNYIEQENLQALFTLLTKEYDLKSNYFNIAKLAILNLRLDLLAMVTSTNKLTNDDRKSLIKLCAMDNLIEGLDILLIPTIAADLFSLACDMNNIEWFEKLIVTSNMIMPAKMGIFEKLAFKIQYYGMLCKILREGRINFAEIILKYYTPHIFFLIACESWDTYVLKYLVDNYSLNEHYEEGMKAACDKKNIEAIKILLEKGCPSTHEVVVTLCIKGCLDLCKSLIVTEECIIAASDNRQDSIVKYFIENGFNVNMGNGILFQNAVMYEQFELARFLIDSGLDERKCTTTLFSDICRKNSAKIIQYWIEKGLNIFLYIDVMIENCRNREHIDLLDFLLSLKK